MNPIKTQFECAGRTFTTLTAALAYERKLRIKDGNFRTVEKVANVKKNSVWDERAKKWILPSGTVRQGRRPMFKAFTKAERAAQSAAFADCCYAASEPICRFCGHDANDLVTDCEHYEGETHGPIIDRECNPCRIGRLAIHS